MLKNHNTQTESRLRLTFIYLKLNSRGRRQEEEARKLTQKADNLSHNDDFIGLLSEHKEREQTVMSVVTRVADSLRQEMVKPLIDYVPNLIWCLLNFTAAQQLRVY